MNISFGKPLLICVSFLWISSLSAQTTFMKTIGGTGDESVNSVLESADGNYLIAGYSTSYGNGGADGYVAKINNLGEEIWSKTFGGEDEDELYGMIQLANSEFILYGWTSSFGAGQEDVWVMKISNTGEEIWTKTFGGSNDERAYAMIQTSDNNLLLTGWTKSFGAGQLDTAGNMIAADVYGSTFDDGFNGFLGKKNDAYISVGGTWSFPGNYHKIWLNEFDLDGNFLWSKTLGTDNESIRIGSSTLIRDDHLLISAYQFNSPFEGNGVLIKVNPTGNVVWSTMYGGKGKTQIHSAVETNNGTLAFGFTDGFGNGGRDILIIRTDEEGRVPNCSLDMGLINYSVVPSNTNASSTFQNFTTGIDQESITTNDVLSTEIFVCNLMTATEDLNASDKAVVSIFPNPNNGFFDLEINLNQSKSASYRLINNLGAVISIERKAKFIGKRTFQFSMIPAGIYFLEVEIEGKKVVKKVVVQ